jgi:hypothetical protein
LIIKVLLFDLKGPKILASNSFVKEITTDEFLRAVVDRYSEVMSELARRVVPISIQEKVTYLARVNEATLVVAVSDSEEFSPEELEAVGKIGEEMRRVVERIPVRDAKTMFAPIVEEQLRTDVRICFLSDPNPSEDDFSSRAVAAIVRSRAQENEAFTDAARIGPFDVSVIPHSYESFVTTVWTQDLAKAPVFALIISTEKPDASLVADAVKKIRDNSDARVLIVPGSDNDLEKAREHESSYFLELCDSVSQKPSELLLSALATAGFTDMHPDLARERWLIDESVDREDQRPVTLDEKPLGHQAFFVIDKTSGEPRFTYLYEDESSLFDMAPNLVAAISQFQIDTNSPAATSVFQAGDLKYAIIEQSDLVFTLVTGDRGDVEVMRSRFSFLPDLYLDESPANIVSSEDLYTSPPFTLKLLATLPPEDLAGRISPITIEPLDWERFESALVKDFLEAVWNSLDGKITVSQLMSGSGPDMIMGAIHLLKRMNAIDWKFQILPSDVPIVVGRVDDEMGSMYTHFDRILMLSEGTMSISDISAELGLDSSVLLTVFGELYRRGNLTFKDENSLSTQS